MLLLPTVRGRRRESPERAEYDLHVPASLEYFTGHFPDFPVLPGVVQLGWAIHWSREEFGLAAGAPAVSQLKFMHPVQPETQLLLRLTQSAGAGIAFVYSDARREYSSGRLAFAEGQSDAR